MGISEGQHYCNGNHKHPQPIDTDQRCFCEQCLDNRRHGSFKRGQLAAWRKVLAHIDAGAGDYDLHAIALEQLGIYEDVAYDCKTGKRTVTRVKRRYCQFKY